jgi:hypothetical protein
VVNGYQKTRKEDVSGQYSLDIVTCIGGSMFYFGSVSSHIFISIKEDANGHTPHRRG